MPGGNARETLILGAGSAGLAVASRRSCRVLDEGRRSRVPRRREECGIHVLVGHRLMRATESSVVVHRPSNEQEVFETGQIIWTGGVQAQESVKGEKIQKGFADPKTERPVPPPRGTPWNGAPASPTPCAVGLNVGGLHRSTAFSRPLFGSDVVRAEDTPGRRLCFPGTHGVPVMTFAGRRSIHAHPARTPRMFQGDGVAAIRRAERTPRDPGAHVHRAGVVSHAGDAADAMILRPRAEPSLISNPETR